MLHLRDDPTPLRVVGIDPGTDTLGVACLELDLLSLRVTLADAHTLHGSRFVPARRGLEAVHGARFTREVGERLCRGQQYAGRR